MIGLALETAAPEARRDLLTSGARPQNVPVSAATVGLSSPEIAAAKKASRASTRDIDETAYPLSGELEDLLIENSAAAKIAFGEFARHFSNEWRRAIFTDIDRLLDIASWDEESAFITPASFRTFLRFLTYTPPKLMPNLGVDPHGLLLAAWLIDGRKVSVSFQANDLAKAVLVLQKPENEVERVAWQGNVASLASFLERNGGLPCLNGAA